MRAIWLGILVIGFGFGNLGASFSASVRPASAGWVWWSCGSGQVQWQFSPLSWAGQSLSVELLIYTQGWPTCPPQFFSLTLEFSTAGAALTRQIQVQRVEEMGKIVVYFGRIILPDWKFGSCFLVCLSGGPTGVQIGVHQDSLRICGERAPLVLPPPSPQEEAKSFWESERPQDAPYLSPGRYRGELGWPGPGSAVDAKDWLRVNLNSGHLLELRVNAPKPVVLVLLDPSGQEVGRVSGSGQIGLVYQASIRGPYVICISITESLPLFTYTLEISIRR